MDDAGCGCTASRATEVAVSLPLRRAFLPPSLLDLGFDFGELNRAGRSLLTF